MKIALVQSATGKSGEASGGSWGHGKKAIAAASAIRVLAAYTCHPYMSGDDNGVTRRLLGVAYWRQHNSATKRHRGLGLCGHLQQGAADTTFGSIEPLTNELADSFVNELKLPCLPVRNPDNLGDHGTSYIFVEPQFGPQELASALERNWWPLHLSSGLELEVFDYEAESVPIAPRMRSQLKPFIQAWDVARGVDTVNDETELRHRIVHDGVDVGMLAVVADPSPDGWSYEVPPNSQNVDLVALIRNDMVIAYQHFPILRPSKAAPYVRGAIIVPADSAASGRLKMAEGHLHNAWKTDVAAVGSRATAQFAKGVLDKINEQVKSLRRKIRPTAEAIDVPIGPFRSIFNPKGTHVGTTGGRGGGGGRKTRDFVIRDVSRSATEYDKSKPTMLRIRGKARIGLRPDYPRASADVEVDLGWAVFEESRQSRDDSLFDETGLVVPSGFSALGGVVRGRLTKDLVEFEWYSTLFPNDWLVVPDPEVRMQRRDDA